MKKPLVCLVISLMILTGVSPVMGSSTLTSDSFDSLSVVLDFSTPTTTMIDADMYVQLNQQTGTTQQQGAPQLPVVSKEFILPAGSVVEEIEVSFSDWSSTSIEDFIVPVDTFSIDSNEDIISSSQKDKEIYTTDSLYPIEEYSVNMGTGLKDDKLVLFVTVETHPVRYNPVQGLIEYADAVEIGFKYTSPEASPVTADEYDMVIITPEKFERTVQKLADHKNDVGVRTFVKTIESIEDELSGRDTLEQIKYFIHDAILTYGINYVIIVGDSFQTPMRLAAVRAWNDDSLPTDLYLADVFDSEMDFCSWDSNSNDEFGEYNWEYGCIDQLDLYPDVYIGRLPCRTSIDLSIMIRKIISYESNAAGTTWSNRILLMGGDTFPGYGPNEGEVVTGEIEEEMSSFDVTKLWTSEGTYNPFSINLKWSQGNLFVSYSGHGYMHGWGTSEPDVEQRVEYYSPYILGMMNGNKLPVVFFDACSTGHFDFTLMGVKVSSIACLLLMQPYGGAVSTIGSTRVAYTNVDWSGVHGGAGYLNVHFFQAYESGTSLGDMFASSISDYVSYVYKDCLTLDEFTLFGDPSLKIGGY